MPEYIITNSKGKEKRYSFPTTDAAVDYLNYARLNNLKVDQVYFDVDNRERRFPVTRIDVDDKGTMFVEVDGDIDRYLTDRNTFTDIGYGLGQKPMSEAYREAYSKGAEPTFEITEGNGARIIEEHDPTRVAPREEYDPVRLQHTVQSVQGLGDRMGGVLSDRGISPIDATQPMGKIAGRTSSPIVDKASEYASSEIGGERLSAEDAARMEESPEYRDVYWNIRRKYGMTPEEYATLSVDNINERIEEALDIAEDLREEAIADQSNWYVDIHGNRLNAKDDQIKATIRAIKRAQRDLNDSRTKYGDKDGWHLGKRFWDGGELIAKLTPIYNMISSLESAGVTMGQAMAAGKMIEDPERLTPEQQLLLSLTSIQQSVAQYQQDMGGKHWASGVGEVLQEMPEFMMGMPLAKLATKAVTKGATKGLAKLAGKAISETAEEATETAAETIARRALDKATGWAKVKQVASDGIGAWGKSFGEAAIGAPTQTLFYRSLADEALGQYQVRPDGSTIQQVTPAWERVYRAWLGTALELHSEDMGMWIGKGLNALGRRMANVGFVRGLMRVPAARSPLMEVVRKELKVADPLSEALGEVYGDAIQPLFTGDLDWSQTLADPDYWLTTVVSSAGVSVAMELPSIMQFKRDADRVNKYSMQMDYSLAVMGEDLRRQLVAAVSHNSIEAQTKALANIDWQNVSRQDMAAAMDYVNAYVGRELYYNSYREAERQTELQRQMNNLLALSYRGESGYGNTMTLVKATAKPSSGLSLVDEYYIISGDYTTQQGARMLNVMRVGKDGVVREVAFADQLNIGEPIDIADQLAKQYDLMFGEELAREGVVSISERIAQMRAEGVNEEVIRAVVSEDPAYHEYKEGDVVTDNQTGEPVTINEQTSTGEYIATKSSGERIAISYDQIADSGAYAEQAIERERTSGGVKEGDVVSFLDRDGEMVEGAVQQILNDGRIYVSVQTGENNGVPTYATQEIIPNQIIPAEAQPAQFTPTEQVAEEVAADAAAEVQATEQTAPAEAPIEPQPAEVASTTDPRAIPTLEDGSIDYDAIEDPQQFIDLYGKSITSEELVADVTSFRDDAQQNVERLRNEVASAKTPNEKKSLRDQISIESNRAAKYQAVLDLLTPATTVVEQAESTPTAPEVAPVAAEVSKFSDLQKSIDRKTAAFKAQQTRKARPNPNVKEINALYPDGIHNMPPYIRALAAIATGTRFVWNSRGPKRGIGAELGFLADDGERKVRIGILARAEKGGVYFDEFVERLWHNEDGNREEDIDDVRNAVIDALRDASSPTKALQILRESANKSAEPYTEMDQEDFDLMVQYNQEQATLNQIEEDDYYWETISVTDEDLASAEKIAIEMWLGSQNNSNFVENLQSYDQQQGDTASNEADRDISPSESDVATGGVLMDQGSPTTDRGDEAPRSAPGTPDGARGIRETRAAAARVAQIEQRVAEIDAQLEAKRKEYNSTKQRIGKEYNADQPDLFGSSDNQLSAASEGGVLFNVQGDYSQQNVNTILKSIQDDIDRLELEKTNLLNSKESSIAEAVKVERLQGELYTSGKQPSAKPKPNISEKENKRRIPLRRRANLWGRKVGVKVVLLESLNEVESKEAQAAIQEAEKNNQKVSGWVDEGKVYLYLPHVDNTDEIDATYIHEVVAHIGMEELMGEKDYKQFCLKVWDMMNEQERDYYYTYEGVRNIKNEEERKARAADEYIAHLAEQTNLEERDATMWEKIVDLFAEIFAKLGLPKNITRLNIEDAIRESYRNLVESNVILEDESGEAVKLSPRFRVTPTFYSNAEYVVNNIKQEKATPEQWLKMVEKNGGLKVGEDKWLGLSDWLKASDKKTLTKDDVLDYIRQNQIQIEEVNYGDVGDVSKEDIYNSNEYLALVDSLTNYGVDEDGNEYPYIDKYRYDDLRSESYDFVDGFTLDYWGETLDINSPAAAAMYLGLSKADKVINDTRLGYTTDGLTNKREIALVVPTIESWNESDSIHFGDAGNGRAIAWVRFGETTDAEGNRVLVIDEVQSKRHQEGREKGYRDVEAEKREKAERERELTEVVLPRLAELNQLYNEKYGVGKWRDTEYDRQWRPRRVYRFLTPEEQAEHESLSIRATELQTTMPRRDGIPSAPFEKNWAELAMKRMLRYAAENGFDKIAWTTGEQQAERYDIGNTVDGIDVIPYEAQSASEIDGFGITIRTNNYGERIELFADRKGEIQSGEIGGTSVAGKHLSDIVGKPLANKIISNEGGVITDVDKSDSAKRADYTNAVMQMMAKYNVSRPVDLQRMISANDKATLDALDPNYVVSARTYSGDGLRIGGEGMRAFYDQMIPSFMNKYGKKWGVKVGEVTMPSLEENNTMHSVDVTDAMRDSVMQGQPMFRITPAMDKAYMDAVERGDMDEAQKMVNVVASAAGYSNDESWKKSHRAPRKSEDNVNPFNTEELVPDDYWTHPEWYTNMRNSADRESYYNMVYAINKYKRLVAEGKQEEADKVTVTMYRGVDKTANKREGSFRNGDWITPSRSYAKMSAPYGKSRVIEQEVPLKYIWWDGNSINEWGYDDGANYTYKDTKNNRKLLDAVTYDDNGNVIPLSQRFNSRESDIRFRKTSATANRNAYNLVREKLQNAGIKVHEVSEEMARQMAEAVAGSEFQLVQRALSSLDKASKTIARWLKNNERGKSFEITLPEATKRKVRKAMGRDFDSHNITANGIAHALKNHGEGGLKLKENSIPIREEDAELIPYIMTAPDRVSKGSTDVSGRESIRFYKDLSNGYVVVVEKEYKNSPNDMETINIWAEMSSKATNAQREAVPDIHVLNAILSTDAAKIRKDAEIAIQNDAKLPEFQIVYHGSGAKFDRFDHSFMGTGEGAQAYGWGTYVTQIKGIGETYAEAMGGKPIKSKINSLALSISNKKDFIKTRKGDIRKNENYDKYAKGIRKNQISLEKELKVARSEENEKDIRFYEGLLETTQWQLDPKNHKNLIDSFWEDINDAQAEVDDMQAQIKQLKKDLAAVPKFLYSVDIIDNLTPDTYISWEGVVDDEVIDRMQEKLTEEYGEDVALTANLKYGQSGQHFYQKLERALDSDRAASEFLHRNGFVGIEYPAQYQSGGRADNAKNYVIFNENDLKIIDRVELFQDSQGKIYGWAVGGEIYLTPDGLNANTAIHEYSHLWVEALRKKDSKKWAEIKSQLQATPFWQQVIDDPNYERIRENEDAVASEVLARLTGKNGAERLASEAQRIIDAGNGSLSARIEATALVQRVKRLLRDLWAWVARNIFGVTNEATISQLSDMVVDDLLNETPLTDAENSPFEAMFIGELGANVLDIEQKVSYRMANMDVAMQMEQAGKSPFDIKIATGWERGADGEWRYEISDAEAHLNIEAMAELNQRLDSGVRQRNADKLRQFEQNNPSLAKKRQEMIEKYSINSSAVEALDEVFELTPVVAEFKLRDLFDYDEAYEAYPQLMNTRVRVIDGMRSLGAHWGDNIDISLEVAQIPARMRATLLHEIQHSIQSIEGFAAGGNKEVAQELMREMEQEVLIFDFASLVRGELREKPDLTDRQVTQKVISELKERTGLTREELESAKRIPSSKQRVEALAAARNPELYEYYWGVFQIFNAALDDEGNIDSMKAYRNLMGEVEARNTTSRRNMTAEQRRSSLGSTTEDVNRGVQIYRSRQGDDFESLSEESKYSSRVEALSAVAYDVAAKLNAPIRVITDMNDIPQARQSWKGWWQRGESGEQIVVVVPNNIDAADIERTILHEAVAHYGLRKLLGESQFNLLLDTVLKSMTEEEVQQRMRKYGTNDPMVVADEYIAEVAEGNVTPSMFERVVSAVRAFLRDVLGLSVQMTDNDIRYLLWQSKNALEGRSAFGRAMVMAQGKPLADMVAEEYGYARAYTAEEQQIIDDAQRNGTYLKAPNGKPTNLTPKQWVQARTMAFKRWFGDWILPTMETPIHKSKGTFANLAEAEKWAKENLQGKKEKNRYTGEEISIGKNSIKEMLDPKFSKAINEQVHISALQSVLDFIKTGVPAEIHPDTHGRDFNVMRLYNAIEIEGKVYRVKSTVRKVKEGDKYYTYEIQEMELLEDTHNALGLPNANDRGRLNSNNSITAAKLLKGVKKTNSNEDILSHSQILDANGEPMVVWHGGTFAINEFTPKWAMHFGTKEAALQRILDQNWGYGNWEIIRNDDDTFGWKYTDPDAGEYEDEDYSRQSDKSFATPIEALEDATESMFDYVAHPYYLNIRNVERVDDMQDDDGWDNAIDEAKRSGVDGLVYRNDFEDEGNDSYIAFRSEQIKSAEINSGEFDPTDPDIRARRKDFLDAEGNTTKATPMKQAKEVKPEREFRANNLFGRFFETFWRYTGASQVVAGKTIDGLVIKAGEKELARRIKKGEELLRKREAPFISAFIKKKIGKGDAMAAFQKLSKADKLQLSKVITGFNPVVDYMSAENRSESQGEYALKKYFDGFIAPLNESRRRMREVMGVSDQELETYVSGESSLERHNSGTDALSTDETKAWSLKKVEGIVTRFRSRLRNNMELQLKQQGANALSEAEKELLGEDLVKKLAEAGYDSLSAGEQMAACEAPVEVLWERIRALNNEHLNILLRAGRYSHDDIERIKSHDWRYYVPMFKQDLNVEGLIDPAAVYDVDVFYGTPSAPSLKPALGRDTKSQDVFRSMYQLGQRCVVFEVRNRVARSLYDFTIWANDHLGLFETRKYWHEGITYQTKTASGKWVDEDTMPSREEREQMLATQREIATLNRERLDIARQINRLSSQIEEVHSEQAADLIDDALRGLVNRKEEILQKIVKLEADRKWRAKKSNFDFEDPTSAQAIERERTVRVWIDGREHRMVFADPDIARAVNGNKNGIVKAIEALGRLVGPFTRFRAQMNTQYSPDFIVSNTLRDYQHALLAMALAEQGDITLSFAGNYFRHLGDVFRSRGINYNPLSEVELKGHVPYYSYERMRSAYIAAKVRGEQITEEDFDRAYRDEVALSRKYLEEVYGKARVRDTFIDAFQRYGGATGFIHQLNSKQIEKQLREAMLLKEDVLARRYVDPTTPFRLIRDVISRVSESMEDITRFATFMAHLDHGASVERAAQEAKEVTTNFNRRGELATGLGSLYMFFNASVQGSAQVMRLIKQHPRRAAAVLPLYAVLGFMQRITRGMLWKIGAATGIKAFFFDDDDEERPRTEEQLAKEKAIRDYMYSDNLIIVLDRTLDAADTALDGIYLRIPQPNGFRAAYKVGVELAEVAMGEQRWDELPESLISTLAGEFVYGFGDTGELTSDMWRMVIPSAVQPISDLLLNKDFVNRTIYNERKYNPIAPAYTVAKSNTPSLYIDASRILNSIGGTDTRSADYNERYEKRAIGLDVPPEAIKYLVGEMFGGVGTFANRMWTTVELMTDGEKGNLAKRDIPFVNRVIGEFEPENVWPKYKSLTDQIEAAWSESSGFRAEQGIDMRKSEWKDPDVTYPYLIEHYKDNPYAVEMLRKRWLLDPYFKEVEDYTKSLKRLGEGTSSSDRTSESREMSSEAEIQQASRTLTEKFVLELSNHVDWQAATNEEVIEQVEQITGEIKGKNQ